MGNPAVVLAPGVVRIPTLGDFINSFAFTDSDGSVTLVDAHPDHAGGAGAMLGATSGRIFERPPTSGSSPIRDHARERIRQFLRAKGHHE